MSQKQALEILCRCVAQYRPSLDDPRRFRAILLDSFKGQSKQELNLLVLALERGVLAEFSSGAGLPGLAVSRASNRLTREYGIQEHLARWAAEAWAVALGVQAEISPVTAQAAEPVLHPQPSPSAASASPDLRPCPFCAELIRKEAIKCRFCGEFLDQGTRPQSAHSQPVHAIPAAPKPPPPPAPPTPPTRSLPPLPLPGPAHPHRVRNSLGMEFVLIQAGSYSMGSPVDEPRRAPDEVRHAVTISQAFYIQTTPVTQAQWKMLTQLNPSRFKGDKRQPVEQVSWKDCQRYIQQLNLRNEGVYRLPTEAEWEYACRAGTQTPFAIGNGYDLDASLANFDGKYPYGKAAKGIDRNETTVVGSFAPNPWGLHDLHGNVWEWCYDWYADYPPGHAVDPKGPATGIHHVMRGGSWDYGAASCRSAARDGRPPDAMSKDVGFRLVRAV